MDESKQGQATVVSTVGSIRQRDLEWLAYIQAIALGDTGALASLFDESSHLVYAIALRVLGNPADAEEVTTDVYSQVWRSAAGFREDRGSASAWLVMLARSRAIDRVRSRKRRKLEDPSARPSMWNPARSRRSRPVDGSNSGRALRRRCNRSLRISGN
jgi:DNA-directed RNA polymerase specialized sigma subunit, sigma24 homolog